MRPIGQYILTPKTTALAPHAKMMHPVKMGLGNLSANAQTAGQGVPAKLT